jgi:hypothetical protein
MLKCENNDVKRMRTLKNNAEQKSTVKIEKRTEDARKFVFHSEAKRQLPISLTVSPRTNVSQPRSS